MPFEVFEKLTPSDIDDVNLKTGTLSIIGKGGDQRDVFFGPEVADALRAYMVGQPIPDDFYEKFGVKGYDYVEFCRDKLTLPNLDEALKNAFPELTDEDIDEILKVAALLRRNGRNSLRPLFGERALFISNRRTRMSVRMVQKMVKEMVFTYLPDYYDKESFSVHKLRTTCCTRILSQTGDLVLAQNQLGHSSIATTSAFYAAWSKEEKQKVVKGLDVTKNW